ncbi:unnamed protein product [Linum trigynum]|uniref:Uncharacterized protein n=1 Tax=Linum trigynum TaxID=586398 RepID=A0AAV2FMS6_9ROSI
MRCRCSFVSSSRDQSCGSTAASSVGVGHRLQLSIRYDVLGGDGTHQILQCKEPLLVPSLCCRETLRHHPSDVVDFVV